MTGPTAEVLRAWLPKGGKNPQDQWLDFTRVGVLSPSLIPALLITKQCLVSLMWWGHTSVSYLLCSSLVLTTSPSIQGGAACGLLVHDKRDIGNGQPDSALSRSGSAHLPIPTLTHATTFGPATGGSNPRERGAPWSDCVLNSSICEIAAFYSFCLKLLASGRVRFSEPEITWNLLLKKPIFVSLSKNCDWIRNSCNSTGKRNLRWETLAYQLWEWVHVSCKSSF